MFVIIFINCVLWYTAITFTGSEACFSIFALYEENGRSDLDFYENVLNVSTCCIICKTSIFHLFMAMHLYLYLLSLEPSNILTG